MEAAALTTSSADQQYSMYPPGMATSRNPKTSTTTQTPPFILQSRSTHGGNLYFDNKFPQMELGMNGGVFLSPPSPLPHSSSHEFRQPPLLPLPISSSTRFQSLPAPRGGGGGGGRGVGFGASPTHKKMHKGSSTKQPSKNKQYPDAKPDLGYAKRWISDPKSVPKNVTFNPNMMRFSELVFALSPPPSSLPIPKFSLKPKA